ncbi:MAG: ABC transporter substrate-binding protein [Clostridia bacterium]|nr:ABC transporter substrate-binding protein [Clostridia bacterium]
MKKKLLSYLLAAATLLCLVSGLSSCGKKDAQINIYLGDEMYDFDPGMACVNNDAAKVLNLLFEPLFRLKANGKVEGALASGYKIEEDAEKNVYKMVITLRETYWNDGNRVVADDVAYAWKRIMEPSFPSQAAPMLYDLKNGLAVKQGEVPIDDLGVEANIDELTLTFEGKIDYEAFLRNLTSIALAPLRENSLDVYKSDRPYWAKKSSYIVSNGMFSIRTLDYNTGEFTLERNKYYRSAEGKAGPGTVTPERLLTMWPDEKFEDYDTFDGDFNAYLSAKLDYLAENTVFYLGALPMGEDGKTVRSSQKNVKSADALATYAYIFNTVNPLFADARVRRALSMVIDRDYIAENLVYAKAATGLISYGVYEASSSGKQFRTEADKAAHLLETKANMDAARALLEEAGEGGGRFTLTVRDSVEDRWVAEYVAEQWEELGYTVYLNFITVDTTVWTDNRNGGRKVVTSVDKNGKETTTTVLDDGMQLTYMYGTFDVIGVDYQMYSTNAFTALCGLTTGMNGNGIDLDPESTTYNQSVLHCSKFSDKTYDEMLKNALDEKDLTKRAEILHNAEAYLLEQMPVVPVYFMENYYIAKGISGITTDGYGNTVFGKAKG